MDSSFFIENLYNWYQKNKRDLPWRSEPSVYKTVVSEVMLQQTKVDTMIPYFHKWLEKFPDFKTLALATEKEVLKMWEGLGYYSRAKNLHRLAQGIVKLGKIPEEPRVWGSFPGIGPYTTAAIASIAFGLPMAVVDGNVIRVFTRLYGDDTLYKANPEAFKVISPLAHNLLNKEDPGDHNQAVMELGAMICTKQKPRCRECPVAKICKANELGTPEKFPNLVKKKIDRVTIDRLWVADKDKVLMKKRPEDDKRLAGFYEFPEAKDFPKVKIDEAAHMTTKNRGISNERITENFYRTKEVKLENEHVNYQWIETSEMKDIQLSGPHRRWLKELFREST